MTSNTNNSNLAPNPNPVTHPATHPATPPATWNEWEIRLLIDQRKYRNHEYHQIIGRSRTMFWESVARRINRAAGSNFTGKQCRRKFDNLVSIYKVSKKTTIKYLCTVITILFFLEYVRVHVSIWRRLYGFRRDVF